jgi:hypothetical protein
MKRPNTAAGASGGVVDPGRLFAGTPTLLGYLSDGVWEGGEERELSTLTIFRQDGTWKAWLNDRANDRFCCVTGRTLEEIVTSMEENLAADRVEWRGSRDRKGSGRR